MQSSLFEARWNVPRLCWEPPRRCFRMREVLHACWQGWKARDEPTLVFVEICDMSLRLWSSILSQAKILLQIAFREEHAFCTFSNYGELRQLFMPQALCNEVSRRRIRREGPPRATQVRYNSGLPISSIVKHFTYMTGHSAPYYEASIILRFRTESIDWFFPVTTRNPMEILVFSRALRCEVRGETYTPLIDQIQKPRGFLPSSRVLEIASGRYDTTSSTIRPWETDDFDLWFISN